MKVGVTDKQHRQEVKSGGLGPKAILAPKEASQWGSVRHQMLRPLFFAARSLGRQIFCDLLRQPPGTKDPAGASWSCLSPRGVKGVELIGAGGLRVGPRGRESRSPVWPPNDS
jgi:hypothetical protein